VATDHAGFALKELVLAWVQELGHEAVDFGAPSDEPVDYPDLIAPAARAVAAGECDLGIVLGGSGTGEAIVANKIRGIRCVEPRRPGHRAPRPGAQRRERSSDGGKDRGAGGRANVRRGLRGGLV